MGFRGERWLSAVLAAWRARVRLFGRAVRASSALSTRWGRTMPTRRGIHAPLPLPSAITPLLVLMGVALPCDRPGTRRRHRRRARASAEHTRAPTIRRPLPALHRRAARRCAFARSLRAAHTLTYTRRCTRSAPLWEQLPPIVATRLLVDVLSPIIMGAPGIAERLSPLRIGPPLVGHDLEEIKEVCARLPGIGNCRPFG